MEIVRGTAARNIRQVQRLCGIVLVALAFAGCEAAQGAGDGLTVSTPPPEVMDARELIVLTTPPVEPLIGRAEAKGYTPTAIYPLEQLDDHLVAFRIPEGRTIPEAIAEVEADSPGVTAGAHHLYRLQSALPSDPDHAGALIRWPEIGCRAVQSVGIVDAGVVERHPGLSDGRIAQRRFTTGDAPPATDHGTLMADLLIGTGRLRDGVLFSANVVDPDRGEGDTAGAVSILRAVDWMSANDVSLVNVSLAGPRNKLLDRTLGKAASNGMVLVAAAGNLGPQAPPQYPAAFPFVLAVTAVDHENAIYANAVRGDHIDVAAPGVDVLIQSDGRLRVKSGTSVATPFVTAVLAASPKLSGLDIAAARQALQDRTIDLGAPGRDPIFGAGLVLAPQNCTD